MIKRYDLINVPCHGGCDSYDELQEVEDGGWVRYDDHAAEVERLSTEGLHHVALILAARNELPDLLAELHTLRARVAELERDAQLGAMVRKAVGCMNACMVEGHTTAPGFTLRQERIISVHQLNVLRAIADALRAEAVLKGGSDV